MGSILFIYQISEVVKNYLLQYKFTEQDVTFLEGNNITSLIVDGVRIMSSSQPNKVITLGIGYNRLLIVMNTTELLIIIKLIHKICNVN